MPGGERAAAAACVAADARAASILGGRESFGARSPSSELDLGRPPARTLYNTPSININENCPKLFVISRGYSKLSLSLLSLYYKYKSVC